MRKRRIQEEQLSVLEQMVKDSLDHVGIKAADTQVALLLRLIFSGLGKHFFFNPDTKFRLGFIEIGKSPEIDELFNVKILRSPEDKIINAETLYKYYKGDFMREEQLKGVLDTFVNELLAYAQGQEISIMNTVNKVNSRKP